MRVYSIVDSELKQAQDFATRLMPTICYLVDRNQSDPAIIQHQNVIGKLGEFAVRRLLKSRGLNCSPVNLEVTNNKVNEEDGWVGICAELPVYKLHDLNLFRDPKKKALIGIKKVVYFKDIPVEYRVY